MKRFFCTAFFLLVASCQDEDDLPGHPQVPDSLSGAQSIDEPPVLSRMQVTWHHVSTEEKNIDCLDDSNQHTWTVYDLDTELPEMQNVEPPINCEPLQVTTDGLYLECSRFINWGFPFYWQRFYFYLVRGENEYDGEVHSVVDGQGYFWCDRTMEVDQVVLFYR